MTSAVAVGESFDREVRRVVPALLSPWPGLLVHAAVVSVIAISLLFAEPATTLALGGVAIFPLYLWLSWREGCRAPLYVSPLSFLFFWNSIGLGLSAIYMASVISGGHYFAFSIMLLSPTDVAYGYVIYLIGLVSIHAGIELFRPTARPNPYQVDLPFQKPLELIFCGLVIGLLYLFRQNWFAFLGSVAVPFSRMAVASVCLLALLPHWYFGLRRHIHWGLLCVGTLTLAVASVKSGSKANIMFAFFPIIWAMIARKELRRNILYAGLALVFLYMGLVAPTITETRNRESGERRTDYGVLWSAAQHASPLLSGDWELDSYSEQLHSYLKRMFDPAPVAFLYQEVELRGLQYGETLKYATYAFIPRLLWPEKPAVSRGAWFTTYLGFSPREEEATTSTGITAVGELYWNFGVPGVIGGMSLIGMLIGKVWQMAGSNPIYYPLRLLLYVHLTLGVPDLAEAVTIIAANICLILLFGSLFFILRNGFRPGARFSHVSNDGDSAYPIADV